jgi:ATP-binding cassette subfamily B protein/subfamily B ATP-binding cassette protein MsbA
VVEPGRPGTVRPTEKDFAAMKNFVRAMRFAWPYRHRFITSLVCALFAAAFWSVMFTSIDPVLKVLRYEKTLQEILNDEIQRINEDRIEPTKANIAKLNETLEKADKLPESEFKTKVKRRTAGHLANEHARLEAATWEVYYREVAKKYVDMLFPEDRFQTVALILGLVVLAVGVKGIFEFWQESLVGGVVCLAQYDLRNSFFRRTVRLDVGDFSENGTHELMTRFTADIEQVGNGMRTLLGKVVAEPLKAIGCVVAACWISWRLTLMFLILVPIAFFILTRLGKMMKRATRRVLERMSSIYQIMQETFLGIRVIKAFSREPGARRKFRAATKDYYHRSMWVVYLDALSGPVIEFFAVAAVAGALLVGAYLVIEKTDKLFITENIGITLLSAPMQAETLLQLYALLAAISDPVRKLSSVFTRIQAGYAASDRIFAYMDKEPKVRPNSDGTPVPPHRREIEFRNVCFSYTPTDPILTGVNLTVKHGETVALIGKNGCGKSTLLSLLPRFYDPDHGAVLIDGVELRTANLRSLRRQLGIVSQDTFLFDGTIAQNIAYGKPNAAPEEIERAARQAHAHDFITGLPKGYETRVGEAGGLLSGGQKQRISLARAFLMNPTILILDEFTSQTDTETEMEVHRILQEFKHTRTTFVITHRLNTLEVADRIVVLDEGRVAAQGTHAELIRTCGVYQRLFEAQSRRLVA